MFLLCRDPTLKLRVRQKNVRHEVMMKHQREGEVQDKIANPATAPSSGAFTRKSLFGTVPCIGLRVTVPFAHKFSECLPFQEKESSYVTRAMRFMQNQYGNLTYLCVPPESLRYDYEPRI